MRRVLAGSVVIVALTAALAGCSVVDEVLEGRRISAERLGADAVLRALTSDLAAVDGVASVAYAFDAADVGSSPGVAVTLTSLDDTLWRDVVTRIEAAGADPRLDGYPIGAELRAETALATFSTDGGAAWLDTPMLRLAGEAASAFPGSMVHLVGDGAWSGVMLTTTSSAEELLSRVRADARVAELLTAARRSGQSLTLAADGADVTGVVGAGILHWAEERLAGGSPRTSTAADSGGVGFDWMHVSIAPDSASGSWGTSAALGEDHPIWHGYLSAIRAGAAQGDDGDCVPTSLSLSWPGGVATAFADCSPAGEPPASEPARPAALRAALAAEGIVPEDLGFTLG